MNLIKYLVIFLFINFGGLALGSWLMNNGPRSLWYIELNKAPWTPPGWVFGVAWTLIMICFSIYLSYLFTQTNTVKTKMLFCIQLFLNVIWNYIFFNQHLILLGLITIIVLSCSVYYFFFSFKTQTKQKRYLLLPYMIWLLIATSLNAYILIYN